MFVQNIGLQGCFNVEPVYFNRNHIKFRDISSRANTICLWDPRDEGHCMLDQGQSLVNGT